MTEQEFMQLSPKDRIENIKQNLAFWIIQLGEFAEANNEEFFKFVERKTRKENETVSESKA
ncbi:MAG: hypothetical protein QXZ28_04965 [Candidatus Methanomethylicaceae archaeon]